ncbi:MAG: hypothetical protein IPH93_16590 [Saprospiraceae bacterium]|nr:hypothetical protein [Saprospiraceae bacterium]
MEQLIPTMHAKLHVSGRIAAEFPAGTGGLGSIAFGFGSGNDSQTGQQNVCIGNSTGSNSLQEILTCFLAHHLDTIILQVNIILSLEHFLVQALVAITI